MPDAGVRLPNTQHIYAKEEQHLAMGTADRQNSPGYLRAGDVGKSSVGHRLWPCSSPVLLLGTGNLGEAIG